MAGRLDGQEITIIGAGVGGLAAAAALGQRGGRVQVLEQAPAITEVGAGLQISPNGMAVLRALGLGPALVKCSLGAEAVELIDGETGQLVTRIELARLAPAGAFRLVHRADLIDLLEGAARVAGAGILCGQRVRSLTLGEGHAPHILLDEARREAPLLIGADGLHSLVRTALNGAAPPFFTGQVAWRATLAEPQALPPVVRVYMGAGRHLVTYPLRDGHIRNIVAVEERARWAEESWSLTDDPLTLRVAFERFIPEVRAWLDRIDRPNLWGLFRHPVAARWQGMGAAILGDAAHPTLPFLAQGANLALEDAWVLAAELDARAAPEALAAYERARAPRAARVVAAATANARNYHLSGLKRDLAHAALRLAQRFAPDAAGNRYRWVYDRDVTRAR
jgi:salicylate hydroxylase